MFDALGFTYDNTEYRNFSKMYPRARLKTNINKLAGRLHMYPWNPLIRDECPAPPRSGFIERLSKQYEQDGGRNFTDNELETFNELLAVAKLLGSLQNGTFNLDKRVICLFHSVLGREEALDWGKFRTGPVYVGGNAYTPPPADELDLRFDVGIRHIKRIRFTIERAFVTFLFLTANQFFNDANKRLGRLIANGILLSHGYPPIIIHPRSRPALDRMFLTFYRTKHARNLLNQLFDIYNWENVPGDKVDLMLNSLAITFEQNLGDYISRFSYEEMF